MDLDLLVARLRRAVHPLAVPPLSPPWNQMELEGLPLPESPQLAAVLVGVVSRSPGASVLLTRRTEQLRQHAGQVSFPGGRVDPTDADPAQAALREACEEVGLHPDQTQVLGYLDPYLTVTGYRVLPVLAMIRSDFAAIPNPGEVAEAFEVPLEFLLDPAMLDQLDITFGGRPRHVLQYRYAAHRIWGATASILYNLRERLQATNQGVA